MKLIYLLIISILLFIGCNSQTTDKEKQLLEKEKELLQKENELLKKENSQQETANKIAKDSTKQEQSAKEADWLGTWSFNDGYVEYTLKIDDKYQSRNLCTYNAEGMQTFYNLDCRGDIKGNSFELYYWGTNDGAFIGEDQINRDKPILTLKLVNGNILTYWNQLSNNYKNNHNGQVCFKKK